MNRDEDVRKMGKYIIINMRILKLSDYFFIVPKWFHHAKDYIFPIVFNLY